MSHKFIATKTYSIRSDEGYEKDIKNSVDVSQPIFCLPKHSEDTYKVAVECFINELAHMNNRKIILDANMKNKQLQIRIYETMRYLGYLINCHSYEKEKTEDYDLKELNKRRPREL